MVALFKTASAAAVALAVLPAVQAHMSIFTPSMWGFDSDWEAVTPLANKGFNDWWFHGNLWGKRPTEVMTIPAGKTLHTEITCGKAYTSWGHSPSQDACPHDSGAYHAGGQTGSESGWWGNSEENLSGCALAIAYKSDASQVRPEDFTIMSVQENCVRQRDTAFEIPVNLPNCPDGECVCAWFWQGKNSAMEMYMTGFRCNVAGGIDTSSFPQPARPKRGNTITGPTQPLYWANDNSNLDYWPDWSTKPTYNRAFGWQNGAQTSAFEGLGGNGNTPVTPSSNSSDSAAPSATGGWEETSSRTRTRTRTGGNGGGGEHTRTDTHWYNHIASPTAGTGEPAQTSAGPVPTQGGSHGGKCKRNLRSRRRQHAKRSTST